MSLDVTLAQGPKGQTGIPSSVEESMGLAPPPNRTVSPSTSLPVQPLAISQTLQFDQFRALKKQPGFETPNTSGVPNRGVGSSIERPRSLWACKMFHGEHRNPSAQKMLAFPFARDPFPPKP